jgi:hypothetical protein
MAVVIIVRSLFEKPSREAMARLCWRAAMISADARMRTRAWSTLGASGELPPSVGIPA